MLYIHVHVVDMCTAYMWMSLKFLQLPRRVCYYNNIIIVCSGVSVMTGAFVP